MTRERGEEWTGVPTRSLAKDLGVLTVRGAVDGVAGVPGLERGVAGKDGALTRLCDASES